MFNYYNMILPNFIEDLKQHLPQKEEELLYFILDIDNFLIKIGKSIHPEKRLKQLETANPFTLKLIYLIPSSHLNINTSELEKSFHLAFKEQHKKGEWFYFKGILECYILQLICNRQFKFQENNATYSYFHKTLDSYLNFRFHSDLFLKEESANITNYFSTILDKNS